MVIFISPNPLIISLVTSISSNIRESIIGNSVLCARRTLWLIYVHVKGCASILIEIGIRNTAGGSDILYLQYSLHTMLVYSDPIAFQSGP